MINAKKAQEEIVGFVVIVVLVSIIALIFLSFSLKNEPSLKENSEINQFLESAFEYTSECSLSGDYYAKIGDLFASCREGRQCQTGEDSCEIVKRTMPEIIDAGLKVGGNRPVKGYMFKTVFLQNTTALSDEEPIILINNGNCTGVKRRGVSEFRPADEGIIRSSLEVCY